MSGSCVLWSPSPDPCVSARGGAENGCSNKWMILPIGIVMVIVFVQHVAHVKMDARGDGHCYGFGILKLKRPCRRGGAAMLSCWRRLRIYLQSGALAQATQVAQLAHSAQCNWRRRRDRPKPACAKCRANAHGAIWRGQCRLKTTKVWPCLLPALAKFVRCF